MLLSRSAHSVHASLPSCLSSKAFIIERRLQQCSCRHLSAVGDHCSLDSVLSSPWTATKAPYAPPRAAASSSATAAQSAATFNRSAQSPPTLTPCCCHITQPEWPTPSHIMARPAARWRRSGPRDVASFTRGPADATPAPFGDQQHSSDHMQPNMPRSFSTFRTLGVPSYGPESGSTPDQDGGGLQRGASGFSSPSLASNTGTPVCASAAICSSPEGQQFNSMVPGSSGDTTGRDMQSPTTLLFGNRGLEAFNALTLDDEYILHFYGVRQTVRNPHTHASNLSPKAF